MSDATTEPRREAAWAQVLGRIEDTLGNSLALSGDEAPPAAQTPPPAPADRTPLEVLDDRLAGLQAALDRAEADASEADALLVASADTLGGWVGEVRGAGQRLADWAARAV